MNSCLGDKVEIEPVADLVWENDRVPRFSVTVEGESPFTTENLGGKGCVIIFYSATCPDCQKLMPVIDAFRRNHADAHGMKVVSIEREKNQEIYNLFALRGVPRVYVCNKYGIVVRVFRDDSPPTLEQLTDCCPECVKE